jgi:hypothetical protein
MRLLIFRRLVTPAAARPPARRRERAPAAATASLRVADACTVTVSRLAHLQRRGASGCADLRSDCFGAVERQERSPGRHCGEGGAGERPWRTWRGRGECTYSRAAESSRRSAGQSSDDRCPLKNDWRADAGARPGMSGPSAARHPTQGAARRGTVSGKRGRSLR